MFAPRSLLAAAATLGATAAADVASSKHFNADSHSSDSAFRQCFSWDRSAETFQGGENFYKSDACHTWAHDALAPFAPMYIILAIVFLGLTLYPVVLGASRLLCNCCGGRKPSYDCCCPSNDAVTRFTGYSRGTVRFTRVLYTLCFAAFVALSVNTFIDAANFRNSGIKAYDSVRNGADSLQSTMDTAASAAKSLSTAGPNGAPALLDSETAYPVILAASYADKIEDNIKAAIHKYEKEHEQHGHHHHHHHDHHENNNGDSFNANGLAALPITFVAIPLCFALAAFVMMLFKVTGFPVTFTAGVFSFTASGVVVLVMLAAPAAFATSTVCRNFDDTVVPAAIGGLRRLGACDIPAVGLAADVAAVNVADIVRDAQSPVCKAMIELGRAGPCGKALSTAETLNLFDDVAEGIWFSQDNSKSANAARNVVQNFVQNYRFPVTQLRDAAAAVTECAEARGILDGTIAEAFCAPHSGVAAVLRRLTAQLGWLVAVALLTLFAMMRGSKRFGNMTTGVNAVAVPQGKALGGQVRYAPIATAEDTADFAEYNSTINGVVIDGDGHAVQI